MPLRYIDHSNSLEALLLCRIKEYYIKRHYYIQKIIFILHHDFNLELDAQEQKQDMRLFLLNLTNIMSVWLKKPQTANLQIAFFSVNNRLQNLTVVLY